MSVKKIIEDFVTHTISLESNNGHGYEREFQDILRQSIQRRSMYVSAEGAKPDNIKKNRYKDILPYDHTRVKLNSDPSVPGSDYINANYIKSYSGDLSYIAAQGPLPSTLIDFWRMLWENDVEVVVMVCNLRENDKARCEIYWSDLGYPRMIGNIKVQMIREERDSNDPEYLRREMMVEKNGVIRTVTQFHYTAWPDHGVPQSVIPIVDMVADIRRKQTSMSKPIVVHCSAGCGRTGTIIIIDYIRNMLENGILREDFSIFNLILELRTQRQSIVQAKEQYAMVHKAVTELLYHYLDTLEKHENKRTSRCQSVNTRLSSQKIEEAEPDYEDFVDSDDDDNMPVGSAVNKFNVMLSTNKPPRPALPPLKPTRGNLIHVPPPPPKPGKVPPPQKPPPPVKPPTPAKPSVPESNAKPDIKPSKKKSETLPAGFNPPSKPQMPPRPPTQKPASTNNNQQEPTKKPPPVRPPPLDLGMILQKAKTLEPTLSAPAQTSPTNIRRKSNDANSSSIKVENVEDLYSKVDYSKKTGSRHRLDSQSSSSLSVSSLEGSDDNGESKDFQKASHFYSEVTDETAEYHLEQPVHEVPAPIQNEEFVYSYAIAREPTDERVKIVQMPAKDIQPYQVVEILQEHERRSVKLPDWVKDSDYVSPGDLGIKQQTPPEKTPLGKTPSLISARSSTSNDAVSASINDRSSKGDREYIEVIDDTEDQPQFKHQGLTFLPLPSQPPSRKSDQRKLSEGSLSLDSKSEQSTGKTKGFMTKLKSLTVGRKQKIQLTKTKSQSVDEMDNADTASLSSQKSQGSGTSCHSIGSSRHSRPVFHNGVDISFGNRVKKPAGRRAPPWKA